MKRWIANYAVTETGECVWHALGIVSGRSVVDAADRAEARLKRRGVLNWSQLRLRPRKPKSWLGGG